MCVYFYSGRLRNLKQHYVIKYLNLRYFYLKSLKLNIQCIKYAFEHCCNFEINPNENFSLKCTESYLKLELHKIQLLNIYFNMFLYRHKNDVL